MDPLPPTTHPPLPEYLGPIIEAYKKDIDRTMLRENLRRTVQERVDAFLDFMKAGEEFKRAGEEAWRRK